MTAIDPHLCESTLFLRAARPADAPDLARLRRASLLELGLLAHDDARAFEASASIEFADLFARGQFSAWLLIAGSRIAGAACVVRYRRLPYARTSWHAELAGVYVEPAWRRRGIARELCREALDAARAHGARKIFVSPSPAGRGLYRELGFTDAGTMSLSFE